MRLDSCGLFDRRRVVECPADTLSFISAIRPRGHKKKVDCWRIEDSPSPGGLSHAAAGMLATQMRASRIETRASPRCDVLSLRERLLEGTDILLRLGEIASALPGVIS